MNGFVKKITCLVVAIILLLQLFCGCSALNIKDYITNGQFYALFIENVNLFGNSFTEMHIDNYELAETWLYKNHLIDKYQLNKYNKLVNKEVVAQVCVRYMEFRKESHIEIKDIDKCHDCQAVRDAVGMQIFDLENGYFDAKQRMTEDDCQVAIDKMLKFEMNAHYDEGELEVEYKDNVVVLEDNIEFTDIEIIENGVSATSAGNVEGGMEASSMVFNKVDGFQTLKTADTRCPIEVKFSISKSDFNMLNPKPEVGKVMVKPYFSREFGQNGLFKNSSFDIYEPSAIMVTKIEDLYLKVKIEGRVASIEEFLKDSDNEKFINKENCSSGCDFKKVDDKTVPEGIKIDIKSEPGYIIVTFGHKFKYEDKIYGKQTWRNPSAEPSLNITAKIGNFKLDTKNIGKLILGKAAESEVKLTYESYFNLNITAGGLRYSPANNGNGGLKYDPQNGFSGHLMTNVKNSRFTGASAGGSQSIKLAQFSFPLGATGFSVRANIYLVIELDGSISFKVDTTNSAELKVTKTDDGYNPTFHVYSDKNEEIDVHANLHAEFQIAPNLSFLGQNLIDAVGKFGGEIDAVASVYSIKQKKSSDKFYATETELNEINKKSEFGYCINSYFELYWGYEFLTTKSLIGKFLINGLGMTTPNDKIKILSYCSHFEDGHTVEKCSRNDELETNHDGIIELSSYKVILVPESQESVNIASIPISNKKFEKNGGILIDVKDKKVASATFNPASNTILITAIEEGSTEIVLKVLQTENGQDFYEQAISVTVYKNKKATTSSKVDAEYPTGLNENYYVVTT